MGIAFIAAKAERFKHQTDEAYKDQLATENLFSGQQEEIARTFRCKCCVPEMPEAGTSVLLFATGHSMKVLHLNQEIATVMSPDSKALSDQMQKANSNLLPAKVVDVRPLSGVFLVQLHDGGL